MNPFRNLFWRTVAIGLFLAQIAAATPYRTPEEISAEFRLSGAAQSPRFEIPRDFRGRQSLDEIAYFAHYRMLCDFLVSMQYLEPGDDLGGMIEGESGSDHSIIETDNTQEAIRIWSQYAVWTGDTAAYGVRIRLAQEYCRRFPAWREGDGYYSIHNCGWGFEAERIYRHAYNDTSWTWYADSCALWVTSNPLPYDPSSTDLGQLNPCAEGLGIGGLYPHAMYRQRADWRNFTLQEARRIRQWFESNPDRLHANEVWALCGGTALWGLCSSLFMEYPDSGQSWISEYGSQLDIWQSTGEWNHSFNTWYCNAQHLCHLITLDSTYWRNAVFITDSLLGLDTDQDGGIPPGRFYPVTNDHSWVSSYMGWMGMERIITSITAFDVMAVGFAKPRTDDPYLAGDSLTVAAQILNLGMETAAVRIFITGQAYAESLDVEIDAGNDAVVSFPRKWVLPDDDTLPDRSPLRMEIAAEYDENPQNDTLTAMIDIRRGVNVVGDISSSFPMPPFPVRVEFYHENYPDSLWTAVEQSTDSNYTNGTRKLMAGWNTIRVIPPLQMMITDVSAELIPGDNPQQVDVLLPATDIALIDDDIGAAYETYYLSALDSLPRRARRWDPIAAGLTSLAGIPTVVWFTGNDSITTLTNEEQSELEAYLENGGHLLLTGQNITDNLGSESAFLTTILHCSTRSNNTGLRRIYGVENNPISDGMDLYLIGSQGAMNQTSPASVYPLSGSTEILHYSSGDAEVCGISGSYGQGQYVFLSFGLEGVSGISGSTNRREILARCLMWFGDDLPSNGFSVKTPNRIELAQNFPNPFNPRTTIRFFVPGGTGPVTLTLFNLLGQEVQRLYHGVPNGRIIAVQWDGMTSDGDPVSSGMYIYRLNTGTETLSKTLQLVR